MVLTPGNINDTTMMTATIDRIRVPRPGRGRPRTRPERVLADKGYPSKANRSYLADRGIKATIPDKTDQRQNRINKGSGGGRPPDFDGRDLQKPQRRRTQLQPPEELARHRDAVRQDRPQLPSRRDPRRSTHLDQHRLIQHTLARWFCELADAMTERWTDATKPLPRLFPAFADHE
jgi:hypothetical protein